MVNATMDVYKACITTFLPTPAKSEKFLRRHFGLRNKCCNVSAGIYVYNLRDFSKVINGLLLIPPKQMTETQKLMRLWVHETYRVFYDRLIDDMDR